jgi:alpha-L-fucosidase
MESIKIAIGSILILSMVFIGCTSSKNEDIKLPMPNAAQYSWHEQERIMFVHWDPSAWHLGNWLDPAQMDRMNFKEGATEQWCKVAKSWGAKQILFVARQTIGFCWWQTETSELSMKNIPYKNGNGDILKELSESCVKFGLNLGIYLFPETPAFNTSGGGKTKDPDMQEAYNNIYRKQLNELLTRYGDIKEVWFDGSLIVPVGDIIEEHAPNAVVFQGPHASIRWPGTESGRLLYPVWYTLKSEYLKTGVSTQYHDDPDGDAWAPLESDTPLYNHYWLWSPENAKHRKSKEELIDCYYKSVGYGGVMVLNATPDSTGYIPRDDVPVYKAFGNEIDRRFSNPIKEIKDKKGSIHTLKFDVPTVVNHIITMEDYKKGQRVRSYKLEAFIDGNWELLIDAISIGRKKIDYFKEIKTTAIKLTITKAAAKPIIRSLSAYYVDNFKGMGSESSNPWVEAGDWDSSPEGRFITIDISKQVTGAALYYVRFEPEVKPKNFVMENAEIHFDGNKAPDTFLQLKGDNELTVNRTASVVEGSSSVLKITLTSKERAKGRVLIRPAFNMNVWHLD